MARKLPKTHIFRGKRYKVCFSKQKSSVIDGTCDAPDTKNKTICITKGLSPDKEMEIIIHESLHACLWDLDEVVIEETASDIAKLLIRFGYIRKERDV